MFEYGLDPNQRDWLGKSFLHICAAKHDVRKGSLKAGLNNINAVRALNCYLFKELQPSPTVACFDLHKDILFKCRTAPFDTSFF